MGRLSQSFLLKVLLAKRCICQFCESQCKGGLHCLLSFLKIGLGVSLASLFKHPNPLAKLRKLTLKLPLPYHCLKDIVKNGAKMTWEKLVEAMKKRH